MKGVKNFFRGLFGGGSNGGGAPATTYIPPEAVEAMSRAGEAHRLKWTDIDFQTGTIRVTPEKGKQPANL